VNDLGQLCTNFVSLIYGGQLVYAVGMPLYTEKQACASKYTKLLTVWTQLLLKKVQACNLV